MVLRNCSRLIVGAIRLPARFQALLVVGRAIGFSGRSLPSCAAREKGKQVGV